MKNKTTLFLLLALSLLLCSCESSADTTKEEIPPTVTFDSTAYMQKNGIEPSPPDTPKNN